MCSTVAVSNHTSLIDILKTDILDTFLTSNDQIESYIYVQSAAAFLFVLGCLIAVSWVVFDGEWFSQA